LREKKHIILFYLLYDMCETYEHMSTLLYDITFGSPESYKYKDLDPMAHKQMSCDKINPKNFLLI